MFLFMVFVLVFLLLLFLLLLFVFFIFLFLALTRRRSPMRRVSVVRARLSGIVHAPVIILAVPIPAIILNHGLSGGGFLLLLAFNWWAYGHFVLKVCLQNLAESYRRLIMREILLAIPEHVSNIHQDNHFFDDIFARAVLFVSHSMLYHLKIEEAFAVVFSLELLDILQRLVWHPQEHRLLLICLHVRLNLRMINHRLQKQMILIVNFEFVRINFGEDFGLVVAVWHE